MSVQHFYKKSVENNRGKCRVCGRDEAVSRGRCRSCDYKNLQPVE